MKITLTKANVPACCANCWFNDWDENGPQCVHPAQWEDDQFELDDEDGSLTFCGDTRTEGGVIDWDNVCEHHHEGVYYRDSDSDAFKAAYKTLVEQRRTEAREALSLKPIQ